jgi:hypothetical protein
VYDEVCILCGATDDIHGGGLLNKLCPKAEVNMTQRTCSKCGGEAGISNTFWIANPEPTYECRTCGYRFRIKKPKKEKQPSNLMKWLRKENENKRRNK